QLYVKRLPPVASPDYSSVGASQADVCTANHERLCADLVGKAHAHDAAADARVHDLTQRRLCRELSGSRVRHLYLRAGSPGAHPITIARVLCPNGGHGGQTQTDKSDRAGNQQGTLAVVHALNAE